MGDVREGRHLAAIMFVDMVDYSARMQDNEPRAIATVRALWERVRPILAQHGGREVDLAGDGMLMEFPGALGAVRCALEINGELRRSNKDLPDRERVRIRAAVHLGDIEHRDGRIYGDGINIAARILTIAPPGGVTLSAHVRDQVHNVIEQPAQRLGAKRFKNIKGPVEVWCIAGPDCTAADLAAARSAAADAATARRWSFGPAVFDERTLELSVAGKPVEVEKKSLDALAALLARAGEVVTKDELLDAVWPGRVLSESALTTAMAKLRAALSDDAQQLIKTVHGFGYRLAAEVKVETAAEAPAAHFDFREGDAPPLRPLWQLVRRLGRGGQGEAWLARHAKTGESRVYKFALDASHLASLKREITLSRVLAEAQASRNCFARILDWNLEQAPYFIECEFSPGGSLEDWVRTQGGPAALPLPQRLELLAQAADAVALAHSVGVLHKDLKPANLLVDTDGAAPRIRLSDFGAGLVLDPERLAEMGITRLGFTRLGPESGGAGTPMYLAPEVIAGQPWTSKADIYALGVMLFQLVAGDFNRTLAPGWERDVQDELLREDIAAAAAGAPSERLGDAQTLAIRLRSLDTRRAERSAARAAQLAAQQAQVRDARYRVRRWWVAGLSAVMALVSVATFFLWLDAAMATTRTMEVLDGIAAKLERKGEWAEAEAIYRQIVEIQRHQAVGPLFPGGFVDWEYHLDSRLDIARVLMEQNRLPAALDEFSRLSADTAAALGTADTYYAFVSSNYGECLLRAGKAAQAREILERAQVVLQASPDHSTWRQQNLDRLRRADQALGLVAEEKAIRSPP